MYLHLPAGRPIFTSTHSQIPLEVTVWQSGEKTKTSKKKLCRKQRRCSLRNQPRSAASRSWSLHGVRARCVGLKTASSASRRRRRACGAGPAPPRTTSWRTWASALVPTPAGKTTFLTLQSFSGRISVDQSLPKTCTQLLSTPQVSVVGQMVDLV